MIQINKLTNWLLSSLLILSLICVQSRSAFAASILAVCSSNKDPDKCPQSKLSFPTYGSSGGSTEFKYKIDRGSVGEIGSEEAISITEEMLDLWSDNSNLVFTKVGDGLLDEDIDQNNYEPILETNSLLGFSPVIWDNDGSIVDDFFGNGSKNNVLGFAGAVFFRVSGSKLSEIRESQALFNGFLFDGDNTGDSPEKARNTFKTTILHEFAHMFGIDHTQGGDLENYNLLSGDYDDIPIMFPVAVNPSLNLHKDDIAVIREAYPLGNESSMFGRIEGKLIKNSKGVKGANVVAYKADESNPKAFAVASPSDVDGAGEGAFTLPNLDPGEYILFTEPMDSSFTEGSSVGIHDPISSNKHTTGFYNGENEMIVSSKLDTGVAQAARIQVSAGQTANVSFTVSGGSSVDSDNDADTANGQAFIVGGKAFNNIISLKLRKKRKVVMKIVNLNPGETREISLSTNHPELIQFKPSSFRFKKRSRRVKVILASLNGFAEVFPELDSFEEVEIPVTITDSSVNFTDNGNILTVF